jgi:hypothetical protein
MRLEEVRCILNAEWLGHIDSRSPLRGVDVLSCHASDLMSDVLTVSREGSLLLTGLTNAQVIRVAEVSDIVAVCFVRGKRPQREVIQLAEQRDIPLLGTALSMYESCGRLWEKGLRGGAGTKDEAD